MKIFLVGGGTGGPTAPLLAVAEALMKLEPKTVFFLVGTKKGLERKFLESWGISMTYLTIPAGKWRRYFSLWNLVDFFKTLAGVVKAWFLLKKHKPDVILGAGSYVQVPVAVAAYFLRVPTIIHQQDFELLLSTKLTAPLASKVTVSFASTARNIPQATGLFLKIPQSKIVVTGNPFRRELLRGSERTAREIFELNPDYPTVLVMGGGTGSAKLNRTLYSSLPELVRYVQVIHLTGGKQPPDLVYQHPHYHPYEFLGGELKHAYAVADLVVSRAGMSTITELSALGKAAIVVPLPKSAQEDNARVLALLRFAVVVFEEFLSPDLLVKLVRKILWNQEMQTVLREGIRRLVPQNAAKKIAQLVLKVSEESQPNYVH